MAVRTQEELMNAVRQYIGDNDDDNALALIEDINDTITDATANNGTDWKKQYEENDAAWRKRYRDRFFTSSMPSSDEDEPEEDNKPLTFESLFKED